LEKKQRQKVIMLLKEKRRIEKELQDLENQLAKELCPKRKSSCEPAYCTFMLTNTCPFLKEWHAITSGFE